MQSLLKPTRCHSTALLVVSLLGLWEGILAAEDGLECNAKWKPLSGKCAGCRYLLVSLPFTGSSWLRSVWEITTGIGTESMYNEGGSGCSSSTGAHGSVCGSFSGRFHPNFCRDIHQAAPDDPVLIKTHHPFIFGEPSKACVCGVITPQRSPASWCKRSGRTEAAANFERSVAKKSHESYVARPNASCESSKSRATPSSSPDPLLLHDLQNCRNPLERRPQEPRVKPLW